MAVEPAQLALDLQGQFARRRDDERERRAGRGQGGGVAEQRLRHRDAIGDGLARAGLGRNQEIPAQGLRGGDGGLNRRRLQIAALLQSEGERGIGCKWVQGSETGSRRKCATARGMRENGERKVVMLLLAYARELPIAKSPRRRKHNKMAAARIGRSGRRAIALRGRQGPRARSERSARPCRRQARCVRLPHSPRFPPRRLRNSATTDTAARWQAPRGIGRLQRWWPGKPPQKARKPGAIRHNVAGNRTGAGATRGKSTIPAERPSSIAAGNAAAAVTAAVRVRPATCSRYAGLQSNMVISSATPSPSMTRNAQLAAGTRALACRERRGVPPAGVAEEIAASSRPPATPNSSAPPPTESESSGDAGGKIRGDRAWRR